MTMGSAQKSDQSEVNTAGPSSALMQSKLILNQQQEEVWRSKVLNLLTQLVQIQEELANHQAQVVKQLGILGTQVGPTLV